MKLSLLKHTALKHSFLLAFIALLAPQSAGAKTLLIYHISDIHGAYAPRDIQAGTTTLRYGGFPALASMAKSEKEPVLIVNSGDWFQGTAEGAYEKGMQGMLLFNLLPTAAAAPGNHDFNYGQDGLRALVSTASFPVVCANLYDKKTGRHSELLKPWAMLEAQGIKIGVTGVLEPRTAPALGRLIEGLEVRDPAREAAAAARELRARGAQAVLVLAHMGMYHHCLSNPREYCLDGPISTDAGAVAVARALKGIPAVIFGGHMHATLPNGYRDPESGVWLAESGVHMQGFTRAELEFDDADGSFKKARLELRPLGPAPNGPDPAMQAAVARLQRTVGDKMDRIIGRCPQTLARESDSSPHLGDWVADIYRKRFKAEVSFVQRTGLRADIQAGPVRARDIYAVLPFDNTIVLMELPGSQILQVLRDNYNYRGKYHMKFSGLRAEYKADASGQLREVKASVNGRPLEQGRLYKIAANSFLLSGAHFAKAFEEHARDVRDTGISMRQPLIDELEETGVIKPPQDARNTER